MVVGGGSRFFSNKNLQKKKIIIFFNNNIKCLTFSWDFACHTCYYCSTFGEEIYLKIDDVCLFVKCFGSPHSGESRVIYLHVLPQSTIKVGVNVPPSIPRYL